MSDRVFLGDPADNDDTTSVVAIATGEDDAVWLEMWSGRHKVTETAVLSAKARQTIRALLA